MKILTQIFETIISAWGKFSARERRLAMAVGVMGGLLLAFIIARGAMDNVRQLNVQIDRYQQDIVNYSYQIAHKKSVETQYAKVAALHSSAWTEAEIHDRLRQEIYRLAQKVPPPLNERGIPVRTTTEEGFLVEIPTLRQGSLHEGSENFREYQIDFDIPLNDLKPVISFLERLQSSPQSLRIDGLEMVRRSPLEKTLAAHAEITRIIASGAPESELEDLEEEDVQESGAVASALNRADWNCDDGEMTTLTPADSPTGREALQATATGAGAEFYRIRSLQAGAVYELYLDISATGEAHVAVGGATENGAFPGAESLRTGGVPHRYHVRFTVPGETGERVRMRAPLFLIPNPETCIRIDNLILRKLIG